MVAAEAAASTHKSLGNQNNERIHQLLAMLAIQQTSAESPTLSEKLNMITRVHPVEKLPILSRRLPSHEAGCNVAERSGKSFNIRQCCQPGTGARFSTLSGDR